jgi:hypothetical protein
VIWSRRFVALLAAACTPTTTTMTALEPSPSNVIARQRSSHTFVLEPGAPTEPACVQSAGGLHRECFADFRLQFERGVRSVLGGVLTEGTAGAADYTARVKTLDLELGADRGYDIYLIAWSFELVDPTGKTVVSMTDTQKSSVHVSYIDDQDLPAVVRTMESPMLERIRAAVVESVAAQ